MPNRLANETSPYLLQHAHNPVDWYPWGPEALERAKLEDKPILVSIGYSACHWCHVMERESFEHEDVAAIMNEHFINIKIDREERPDIDQIYMDAVQVLTGQGGWPLNMFLTPGAKPFYGGTYFPPRPVHGRPSWPQALHWVQQTFATQRDKVEEQAQKITEHIVGMDQALIKALEKTPTKDWVNIANKVMGQLKPRFDKRFGGFGSAPKFPNPFNMKFLLRHHYVTGNVEALEHTLLTLTKMCQGGIYDQLGGGFSRYSVDEYWLAPHFEKMLYDNALLVSLLAEAFQITNDAFFKDKAQETLEFIERELTHPQGGFYAALDADSEGVEGKFYTWQAEEIKELLGNDATWFIHYFDVSDEGNWEHINILNTSLNEAMFAQEMGWTLQVFKDKLQQAKQRLMEARDKRIRPGLDDKIILGWNALMISAYAAAAQAFGNHTYAERATRSLDFVLQNLYPNGELMHTWKDGQAKFPAFLDDYACLIEALLDTYQTIFKERYLLLAIELTEQVQVRFMDANGPMYYYTQANQKDVIVRKREVFDSVTPAGNSVMARNLFRLAVLTGNEALHLRAEAMMDNMSAAIAAYGGSCTNWASVLLEYSKPVQEVAIVGPRHTEFAKAIAQRFNPQRMMMAAPAESEQWPLLQNRTSTSNETLIYLCQNYTCQRPVNSVAAFWAMLE
ncbi:thioredoxin domain-containing protein [soil metagenome]